MSISCIPDHGPNIAQGTETKPVSTPCSPPFSRNDRSLARGHRGVRGHLAGRRHAPYLPAHVRALEGRVDPGLPGRARARAGPRRRDEGPAARDRLRPDVPAGGGGVSPAHAPDPLTRPRYTAGRSRAISSVG